MCACVCVRACMLEIFHVSMCVYRTCLRQGIWKHESVHAARCAYRPKWCSPPCGHVSQRHQLRGREVYGNGSKSCETTGYCQWLAMLLCVREMAVRSPTVGLSIPMVYFLVCLSLFGSQPDPYDSELGRACWSHLSPSCNLQRNWSWLINNVNAVFQCRKLGFLTNKLIYENSVVERFLSSPGFLDASIWRQYVPSKRRDVVNPWHSVYPRRKELLATPLREAHNSQNYLLFKPLIQIAVISVHLNKKNINQTRLKIHTKRGKGPFHFWGR